MQEAYGYEQEPALWTSLGFAGGIGRCQDVCGAISGGIIAIGLDSGTKLKEFDAAWSRSSQLSRRLYRDFQQAFGHTGCLALVGPILSDKEIMRLWRENKLFLSHCYEYVKWVVTTLIDWQEKEEQGQGAMGKTQG